MMHSRPFVFCQTTENKTSNRLQHNASTSSGRGEPIVPPLELHKEDSIESLSKNLKHTFGEQGMKDVELEIGIGL